MKRPLNIQLFSFLFLILVFAQCSSDSKGLDEDVVKGTVSFEQQSIEPLQWDVEKLTLKIVWANTAWKLVPASGGDVVERVSVEMGGNREGGGEVEVEVTLYPNLSSAERSQDLLLVNFSTSETTRLKITQLITSGSTKITLHPDVTYQKVTGFGGMLNPTWTGNNLTDADVEKLYGDLGFNIIRMMLYPNKNDWGVNTETAKKAQSLGAIVFASPWTPPSDMKSNGKNSNEDGGYLLPDKYPDYATHINDFVQFQRDKGLNIYAVSIQNEPDWKIEYDGCSWTPAQMVNFVKNHGAQLGAKVMAAEAVNNTNKSYTNALLNDAETVSKFDIVATHLYGGGLAEDALAKQKGKEFWMTEHCINEDHRTPDMPEFNWTWKPSIDYFAKEIHDCMSTGMNAYVWWYLKRYYSFIGDGDGRNEAKEGEVTKRGYIMGHYSKYATGKTRFKTEVKNAQPMDKELLITAYQSGNEMAVVIINRNSTGLRVELAVPQEVNEASAIESTETREMSAVEAEISADKKTVSLGLASYSIVSVQINL